MKRLEVSTVGRTRRRLAKVGSCRRVWKGVGMVAGAEGRGAGDCMAADGLRGGRVERGWGWLVVCLFGGWEGMGEKEVWIVGREGDEGGVRAERGLGRGYKSGRDKGNGTGDFRRGSLHVSKRDG